PFERDGTYTSASGIERGVKRAVSVQPRDATLRRTVEAVKAARNEDLAVFRLQDGLQDLRRIYSDSRSVPRNARAAAIERRIKTCRESYLSLCLNCTDDENDDYQEAKYKYVSHGGKLSSIFQKIRVFFSESGSNSLLTAQ